MSAIRAKVMRITPAQAKKWLAQNTTNRRINKPQVRELTAAMERGEWEVNGESLVIASNGQLLDGQHRLLAIARSGVTIDTMVVTGVDKKVFYTMDQGRKRTLSSVLDIRGEKDANNLAATINLLHFARNGWVNTLPPTVRASEKLLNDNPGIRHSVEMSHRKELDKMVHVTNVALVHYLATEAAGVDKADEFVDALVYGIGLGDGHPVLALRDRLHRMALQRAKRQGDRVQRKVTLAYLIKTWNAFITGEQMRVLRFGANEGFPTVKGSDDLPRKQYVSIRRRLPNSPRRAAAPVA